jgi:ATP-dependent helicase/nuclease subunit A
VRLGRLGLLLSIDLPLRGDVSTSALTLTGEQADAVARRHGRLIVAANAGSGKTTVLVQRFVRTVLDDGIAPDRILAITYTDKAAGEMRARVRHALLALGERRLAQDTESAWVSTIHGLCARILHGHAVAAGLDPAFVTLDGAETRALRERAFDRALAELLADGAAAALDLVAAYGPDHLRAMVSTTYDERRSAGHRHPRLPVPAVAIDLDALAAELHDAAVAAAAEIGPIASGVTVAKARTALEQCVALLDRDSSPGARALGDVSLPGGTVTALSGPACTAYRDAHAAYLKALCDVRGAAALELIDELLRRFDVAFDDAKRAVSGLDFDDLQLCARDLLAGSPAIADSYAERFEAIMVDEFQDTSPLQLELIDRLDRDNTFYVGDALQSIYGFRHASVALFTQRRAALAPFDAATTLAGNFRSRPALVAAFNQAFGALLQEHAAPLDAQRDPGSDRAAVELLVTDTDGWDEPDAPQLGTLPARNAWRAAEARLIAQRVSDLITAGEFAARDIAVLLRASTDIAVYERALQEAGVATLASGGGGFWARQQIQDLTSYLAALVNPRDEASLLGVLASPLVGVSSDGLALLAGSAHERRTSIYDVLGDPPPLPDPDGQRIAAFADELASERELAPRLGLGELLERVVARTRYDEHVLTLPAGRQRLANVHKLIRLAAAFEERHGRDVRALVERANAELDPEAAREPDAPVDLAGLDAVRLMTIHAAKGLEFGVVVVADLGRQKMLASPLLAVGEGGRVGLKLYGLDGSREDALDLDALEAQRRAADADEERRIFYVACTRARELLILSGAVKIAKWPATNPSAPPISWLGPAFVADLQPRLVAGVMQEPAGAVALARNAPDTVGTVLRATSLNPAGPPPGATDELTPEPQSALPGLDGDGRAAIADPPPVEALSYSALASYEECGYRFYLQRVLRMAPDDPPPGFRSAVAPPDVAEPELPIEAMLRGTLAHELLEEIDLRAPALPSAERLAAAAARHELELDDAGTTDLLRLVQAAIDTDVLARIGGADDIRREHRFSFLLGPGGPLVNGVVDVLARERSGAAVVVDYKTDVVAPDADLEAAVERSYGVQRALYALAALRDGATTVDVCHLYLERPDAPVVARFEAADAPRLQAQLRERAAGLLAARFVASRRPWLGLCATCPGRAALCEHPPELTERPLPPPV